MSLEKPSVVVTRRLPKDVEVRMSELFRTSLNKDDIPFTNEQLLEAVRTTEILVPTVTDQIDADLLRQAGPQLKMIANFGAGVDHIDLEEAHKRHIMVTNTPGVLTEDTADMTMALLLSVARRLSEGERLVRSGDWNGWAPTTMLGHRIWGKRLGIIGMGRIGQAVARRARGFGISVHYHNRTAISEEIERELDATFWDDLDQMLEHMDIVSLNCPLTDSTHHILNADRLKLLQPHCFVVNTSRGEVIDEEALADMLTEGLIAGAALDVHEKKSAVNARLIDLNNVVLLPHLGSATIEGRVAMGERVIINIKSVVDGHRPPDRIFKAML
jgi:glyoxylate reductase